MTFPPFRGRGFHGGELWQLSPGEGGDAVAYYPFSRAFSATTQIADARMKLITISIVIGGSVGRFPSAAS